MTEGTLRNSHEVIVVGGGQAGLALGYHLANRGKDFTILEAASEPAAAWRERWDSLKLFTSARYDGLPGMDFPGDPDRYPTRDEVADYLTDYARRFDLPVELNSRVKGVRRRGRAVCRGARGPHVRGAAGRDRHRPVPDAARSAAGPGSWRRGRADAQRRVSVPGVGPRRASACGGRWEHGLSDRAGAVCLARRAPVDRIAPDAAASAHPGPRPLLVPREDRSDPEDGRLSHGTSDV